MIQWEAKTGVVKGIDKFYDYYLPFDDSGDLLLIEKWRATKPR